MAKRRNPDYHADVYLYICNTIRARGAFPTSTEIAQRLNLNYKTVYNCLKILESHGLIETRQGKREAGVLQVERRIKSRVKRPVTPNPRRSGRR